MPCALPITLRHDPARTLVYAVVFRRRPDGALQLFQITDGTGWHTPDEIDDTLFGWTSLLSGSGGTPVGDYSDFIVPLDEEDIPGWYNGSVPDFSSGGDEIIVEWWESADGATPNRANDTLLGTRSFFYDDLSCTEFPTREAYMLHQATVGVQLGGQYGSPDSSNEVIREGQDACCARITDILALVRAIYSQTYERRGDRR
jgi:hypothetical protein